MKLDKPLGTWHHVKQYVWFSCYWTETAIYYQEEDTGKFQVCCEKGVGFHNYEKKTSQIYQQRATPLLARRPDSRIGPIDLYGLII